MAEMPIFFLCIEIDVNVWRTILQQVIVQLCSELPVVSAPKMNVVHCLLANIKVLL